MYLLFTKIIVNLHTVSFIKKVLFVQTQAEKQSLNKFFIKLAYINGSNGCDVALGWKLEGTAEQWQLSKSLATSG